MNENSKIRIEVTNDRKKEIIAILIVLILAFLWIWYGVGISDNGRGAESVRNELESAREEQRDQAAALDRAENAAVRSQSAIRDSEERADRVQELERSDAEIIRESQSILEAVRGRGKKEN